MRLTRVMRLGNGSGNCQIIGQRQYGSNTYTGPKKASREIRTLELTRSKFLRYRTLP